MNTLLATVSVSGFSMIHFAAGFAVMICVLAILIIAAKWLLGLAGISIPPPLMTIIGILLFLILLLAVFEYSGIYSF